MIDVVAWKGVASVVEILLQQYQLSFEDRQLTCVKWENSFVYVCWHLGHLYTGTSDGKILHIHKGEITTIATLGKPPCGSYQIVVSFLN